MATGLARVGLPSRMILIVCVTVLLPSGCCWVIVIVHGRPVVVIWMIVSYIFVDVQRRRHGRRHDQGLSKQECDEPAHGSSLLRPARTLRKTRRVSRLGEWTDYLSVEISTSRTSIRESRPRLPRRPWRGDRGLQGQGELYAQRLVPTPRASRSMCARELYVPARVTQLPRARSGGC
jgi:hypothetical protein